VSARIAQKPTKLRVFNSATLKTLRERSPFPDTASPRYERMALTGFAASVFLLLGVQAQKRT